jgi:hypothetical protein
VDVAEQLRLVPAQVLRELGLGGLLLGHTRGPWASQMPTAVSFVRRRAIVTANAPDFRRRGDAGRPRRSQMLGYKSDPVDDS